MNLLTFCLIQHSEIAPVQTQLEVYSLRVIQTHDSVLVLPCLQTNLNLPNLCFLFILFLCNTISILVRLGLFVFVIERNNVVKKSSKQFYNYSVTG